MRRGLEDEWQGEGTQRSQVLPQIISLVSKAFCSEIFASILASIEIYPMMWPTFWRPEGSEAFSNQEEDKDQVGTMDVGSVGTIMSALELNFQGRGTLPDQRQWLLSTILYSSRGRRTKTRRQGTSIVVSTSS